MSDTELAAPCGVYCGGCEYLEGQCSGCVAVAGKPFWAGDIPGGICPLYECCVNKEKLEYCGMCASFPCDLFVGMRDPSWSDEEAKLMLERRKANVLRRKEIGTAAWVEEQARA